MFVSYLILTLLCFQTALLARPGGEVSKTQRLVKNPLVTVAFASCLLRWAVNDFYAVRRFRIVLFVLCEKLLLWLSFGGLFGSGDFSLLFCFGAVWLGFFLSLQKPEGTKGE